MKGLEFSHVSRINNHVYTENYTMICHRANRNCRTPLINCKTHPDSRDVKMQENVCLRNDERQHSKVNLCCLIEARLPKWVYNILDIIHDPEIKDSLVVFPRYETVGQHPPLFQKSKGTRIRSDNLKLLGRQYSKQGPQILWLHSYHLVTAVFVLKTEGYRSTFVFQR